MAVAATARSQVWVRWRPRRSQHLFTAAAHRADRARAHAVGGHGKVSNPTPHPNRVHAVGGHGKVSNPTPHPNRAYAVRGHGKVST
eukprot:2204250-Prymnesium_polylepis.1